MSWISSPNASGWVRPAFTPAYSPELEIRWRTTGTLILLHLLTLGNGPEPISPFLLYLLLAAASLRGKRSLCSKDALIDLGTLYHLDSGSADVLRPWMVLKESDQLSGFANGRVPPELTSIRFLLSQFNYQVILISHSPEISALNRLGTVDQCGSEPEQGQPRVLDLGPGCRITPWVPVSVGDAAIQENAGGVHYSIDGR
jgi:hypothetical protein